MNITPERREKLEAALGKYVIAAQDFNEQWQLACQEDSCAAFDLIGEYPKYLPSFDEHVADLMALRVKPDRANLQRVSCVALWTKVLPADPVAASDHEEPGEVLELKKDKVVVRWWDGAETFEDYGDLHAFREIVVNGSTHNDPYRTHPSQDPSNRLSLCQ